MLRFARSLERDIFANLALEDHLLDTTAPGERLLLLWRADDAVVLGKNQNPWMECNLPYIAREGIQLARRVSGGGTVFHDAGNLNYSFFLPRWTYADSCIYTLVIEALALLGIEAECAGERGITVGNKKVGGTAFCYRKDRVLHHGTLLVDADLEKLNEALQPQWEGIKSHSVRSKPAEVVNLGCGMAALEQALQTAFDETFAGASADTALDYTSRAVDVARFRSDAWIYGRTPRFTWQGPGGPVRVEKGVVSEAADASWIGRPFRVCV